MTKQTFDINKLRIASPCSADWETMSGNDRKRSCDLCRLNVYNFSEMTAKEVENLIAKSEGRICGRFYKRADGTILTKDCPVGLRAYQKRVARFAGAALTAILGLFSASFGQKTDEKSVDASKLKIVRTVNQENILVGTVVDTTGAVIQNAEILLRKGEIIIDSTHSNEEGVFSFPYLTIGNFSLEITVPYFEKRVINNIEIKSNEKSRIEITVELNAGALMGDVVIIDDAEAKTEEIKLLQIDRPSVEAIKSLIPVTEKSEKPQ